MILDSRFEPRIAGWTNAEHGISAAVPSPPHPITS